jgi:hypothetical protein
MVDQRNLTRLRVAIVAAVIAASALIAPRGSSLLVVGALAAIGFILLCLRWPPLGVLAIIPVSQLVPFAVHTGTNSDINSALLISVLLLGLWLLRMIVQRNLSLISSRPIRPLIALVLVTVLSFLIGLQPMTPFAATAPLPSQLGGLAIFVLSAGVFLVVAHQVQNIRWLRIVVWSFIALGALYITGRIVPGLGLLSRFFQPGADGGMFWPWFVAMGLSQAVLNRNLRLHWRLIIAGVVLATLWFAVFRAYDWHSGWVPPLIAVLVILSIRAPRLMLPFILVSGVLMALNWRSVSGALLDTSTSYDILTRTAAWQILGEIIKISPIVGLGPANYYFYTPLFSILGYHVSFNSHNNYVDLVAQTGFVGLGCFLLFVWELLRLSWKLLKSVPAGFEHAYVCGALAGLVATLVSAALGDWLLPFVYNIGLLGYRASVLPWLFLGGLVFLEQNVRVAHGARSRVHGIPEGWYPTLEASK